jgi:uncharacterized lipoprotein NlpE involved in copper resistance
MKANIFITTLLLFILIGCNSQQSEQLTQQQKEQITKEARIVMDSIFAKFGRLDVVGALEYYSRELLVVGDKSVVPFQTIKENWIEAFGSMTTAKWTPVQWEYTVLTKDLVISTWIGKMEFIMKSGDKGTCDPQCYTDVLKKVGGQWKSIYEHASGTPVMQAAEKK